MSEVTTYHELTVLRAKVERLEAENARRVAGGCARNQTTTQFCAEAVALQAEVTQLREALKEYVNIVVEMEGVTFLDQMKNAEFKFVIEANLAEQEKYND